ncbi:hypothetical protein PoB_000780400 [Plakobranchus ocellatus]|uniref:Uncharacterized protein n=1 Tax=Plakobranchus ocellatus TaxID=259542 RepID=A0AAV3YE76_9GAST|nr:hypothetical protein PoB_000780400 [Plakobranchus ocellatus]
MADKGSETAQWNTAKKSNTTMTNSKVYGKSAKDYARSKNTTQLSSEMRLITSTAQEQSVKNIRQDNERALTKSFDSTPGKGTPDFQAIDVVGLINPSSGKRSRLILNLVDNVTRYVEEVSIRNRCQDVPGEQLLGSSRKRLHLRMEASEGSLGAALNGQPLAALFFYLAITKMSDVTVSKKPKHKKKFY